MRKFTPRHRYRWALAMLMLLVCSCSPRSVPPVGQDPAAQLQHKLAALSQNSASSPVAPQSIQFVEQEVNLFLRDYLKDKVPPAISEPYVTLLDHSRIVARLRVDIDEIKRNRKRISGPLNFLSGKIPVLLHGDLNARNGQGQFTLRTAEVNGLAMPRALVLDLLANHTRTRDNPQGFNLEQPFELPLSIREMIISSGAVLVVQ